MSKIGDGGDGRDLLIRTLREEVAALRLANGRLREAVLAYIPHAAWVGFQIAAGQQYNLIPDADDLRSQIDGNAALDRNPSLTAEENHDNWMRYRISRGWKYGPVKDDVAKTHPDLVPFDELPAVEQRKDVMDVEARKLARAALSTPYPEWQEVRWLLETGTSGTHESVDPDEWERRRDALLGGKP